MTEPNDEFDVIVVGGGAGGLTAAVTAADRGASVLLLEKANRLGGTTRKSVGAVWLPNNRFLRSEGLVDDRDAVLRYLARLSRPTRFDPRHRCLGLPDWEYEGLAAFVDNAAIAHESLEAMGALKLASSREIGVVDYLGHLPEDECPSGRTLYPATAKGGRSGGQELVDGLAGAARARSVDIRLERPVTGVLTDDGGRVAGVRYATPDGTGHTALARFGVVFGSGGFAHNEDLRQQFLGGPPMYSCAATTNTGDFLPIAAGLGAHLGNMCEAWLAPICIERALREPDDVFSAFYILGDAMMVVNRQGFRVANEKAPYNERARAFTIWDERRLEYLNSPLIAIWDQVDAETWAMDALGNPIPPVDEPDPYWVATGSDLGELSANIDARLAKLGPAVGYARLAPDFVQNLSMTFERFGEFAEDGVDQDFGRGETPFERYVSRRFGEGTGRNPMLRRPSPVGPYYATLLGLGALDTKGGPRTDRTGAVRHAMGGTIPGLFAVGNCAASPLGQGYPGAGATLGPIITSGFLTGRHLGDLARQGEKSRPVPAAGPPADAAS